jgi:hypothetical protein
MPGFFWHGDIDKVVSSFISISLFLWFIVLFWLRGHPDHGVSDFFFWAFLYLTLRKNKQRG